MTFETSTQFYPQDPSKRWIEFIQRGEPASREQVERALAHVMLPNTATRIAS